MLSNKADMLVLKEDATASLKIGEQSKSLTKVLTGPQLIALVRPSRSCTTMPTACFS